MWARDRAAGNESGQAIVLVALILVLGVLLFIPLAVDGGRLYLEKYRAQGAADSAAMAGALALCRGTNIQAASLANAQFNEYDNNGTTNSVVIEAPPSSGTYAGHSEYVRVRINSVVDSAFAHLVFEGPLETTVTAISRCKVGGPAGDGAALISLDRTRKGSLSSVGKGSLFVNGNIITNSDHGQALRAVGGGHMSANHIAVVGGYEASWTSTINPIPQIIPTPILDPLTFLSPPPKPTGVCSNLQITDGNPHSIDPGLYCRVSLSGSGDVALNPGVYWIESGDFTITGTSNVTGHGILIYLGSGAGKFNLAGLGNITLSPSNLGDYAGLTVYMDRGNGRSLSVTGNGTLTSISGTLYSPSSRVELTGNSGVTVLYAQFIANEILIGGNGDLQLIYDPDRIIQVPPSVSLVE